MRTLAIAVIALVGICTGLSAQDTTAGKPKAPKKDPNVIAAWEIEEVAGQAHDAYDVVQLLRPRFFHIRAQGTGNDHWNGGPGVLVDDTPRGDVSSLRSVQISAIHEIRYVSGPDAASRYGAEYHAGAIVVKLK